MDNTTVSPLHGEGLVRLHNVFTCLCNHQLDLQVKVSSIEISPDSKIVALCYRGDVHLWDTTGACQLLKDPRWSLATSLACSPDRSTFGASDGGNIRLWSVHTGTLRQEFEAETRFIEYLSRETAPYMLTEQ
jgi:WD40 repeat protein